MLAFRFGSSYVSAMATLLEKIEADAAGRLLLPPSRQPSQELARYKNFLKVESHRLKMLHRAGAGGREICQARAAVLDVLLRYILNAVEASTRVEGKMPPPDFALVAMGGYGRGELNPQSDIDIMFLHNGDTISAARGKPHPYLSALTDGVLYPLWDIGLKVGHSVRTVDDCVKVANSDMQSKTSLIEARFIAGDEAMFRRMEAVVLARFVRGFEDEYIAARLADQEARRAKFGNSATMQEPNIKNGCGGLRDFQNLIWMAFFKYRTRSLAELEKRELISESERKQLEAAYDFLLRARNDLHYHVNRPADVVVQVVACAQEKIVRGFELFALAFADELPLFQLRKRPRAVFEKRHPNQILKIAQAAAAVFDVRLLHRRGIAELRPPRLLVRQARRNIFVRKIPHTPGQHDGFHALEQPCVARDESRLD